jgi:Holliday junction DNA helicase RuvA
MNGLISYVKGDLEYIGEEWIIVEANGIGYQIWISGSTISRLPVRGNEVRIYTHLHVREDVMMLYGFMTLEELQMFEMLIAVSGIGPKGALGILSTIAPTDLMLAVIAEDIKTLSKAPGIGKKTAQRMILDLKDKIKALDPVAVDEQSVISTNSSIIEEAISALVALGYGKTEAAKVVRINASEEMSVEQMIKLALKKLSTL